MKTSMAQAGGHVPSWYVVDATGKTLGRLASRLALRLRGKHSPTYAPNHLKGDHIIVIHAERIELTGTKPQKKVYHHYTGYPGGLKTTTFSQMATKFPTRVIEKAVRGMLPKNPLGRMAAKRLKVYAGASHPHAAQQPRALEEV